MIRFTGNFGFSDWIPTFSGNRLRRDLQRQEFDAVTRIPAEDLKCVFYLYPSSVAAKAGQRLGGSGFWVQMQSHRVSNFHWLYAVSNRHVVHANGATTIRANARDGSVKTFDTEPTDWIEHPAGHDIAVLPMIGSSVLPFVDVIAVEPKQLVLEQHVRQNDIGIGDEVYMIGRFINHEGKERNTPSVRFGNISMLPGEPIFVDQNTKPQESFAVELRSMCGYSGAPVFVQTGGWRKTKNGNWDVFLGSNIDLLLGVHWGHIIEPWTVERRIVKGGAIAGLRPGEVEIDQVAANTGMNGVVPAWRLMELLNMPKVQDLRAADEEEEIERRKRSMPGARLDGAIGEVVGLPKDANPQHREDFTALLGEGARKPTQGG